MTHHTSKTLAIIVLFTVGYLLFASISFVFALEIESTGEEGLVPCGTQKSPDGKILNPCQPCHIFKLVKNVIDFIFKLVLPAAALMLAYGGFLMIIPGAGGEKSAAMLTKGKKVITNTLVGILIIYLAWLTIDTIIKALAGQDIGSDTAAKIFSPWNKIECEFTSVDTTSPSPPPNVSNYTRITELPEAKRALCPTCVNVSVPMKPASLACGLPTCQIDSDLNNRLQEFNRLLGKPGGYWWVTEAWPPTRTHENPCHARGTCVDANLRGGAAGNPDDINNFISTARAANLRAVYEVATPERARTLESAGIPTVLVPGITGEHFSIYKGG